MRYIWMNENNEPRENKTERNEQEPGLFKYFFQHQSKKQKAKQHVERWNGSKKEKLSNIESL